MTPAELIAAFDDLADAPGGVPSLRQLVLRLAVRGRLVAQDGSDEPSHALQPRLSSARAHLVENGIIRAPKPMPPISPGQVPFDVPKGWTWVRLIDVAWPQAGFAFKAVSFNEAGRGMPLIRIRDIDNESTEAFYDGDYRPEFLVQTGEYLIGMDGNFNVRRWKGPAALLNQRVSRLIFYGHTAPAFVAIALQERLDELLGVKAYTTVQHLSGGQISEALVPLPPLAEQRRIVARVEELMGLLDRLEAARAKRETTRAAARDSVLAALREADSPAEVDAAWTRFAQRMDDLVCDPADIAPLRQTVLQLAVRGRLVPQDPKDEPASVLLEHISAESQRLVSAGKARAREPSQPIPNSEVPSWLPTSWVAVRLSDVAAHRSGNSKLIKGKLFDAPAANRFPGFSAAGQDVWLEGYEWEGEAIIVSAVGARCGKTFLAAGKWSAVANTHIVWPYASIIAIDFLQLSLNNERFWSRSGGAQPFVQFRESFEKVLGLPPLAEQRRIVARVEELMGLLDRLEARLTAGKAVHESFAAAAVHHLET